MGCKYIPGKIYYPVKIFTGLGISVLLGEEYISLAR